MKEITTDKALIFSATLLIIYTIICIIQEFMGIVPDSTLTTCFFIAFGVAEGGFCTAIHINKKKRKDEANGCFNIGNGIYIRVFVYLLGFRQRR